ATPVERALAEALCARYPQPTAEGEQAGWNRDYADAMRTVYQRFPDDLEVAALYADALMNLSPWALWDQRTGEPAAGAFTLEAKSVLDRALRGEAGRAHPGILHLYIHLMEMSPTPESALAVADRLRELVPDAGHLRHMPSHLDVLCGDYRSVVAANSAAIAADEKFVRHAGALNFYTLYRAHNYHFKIYGAMFLGQSATALETAERLENSLPEELLRVPSPPMADWLESFVGMRVHVLVRFGRWADLIALELPKDPELYCVTTALLHYGKGVAYSATGRIDEAERERDLFHAAVARVPESRTLFNNTCRDVLAIAAAMLDGELLYRKGDYDKAFEALRRSVELDDTLPYDEPWGWMQPTRHALGALLLEQDRILEAEAVYRADLGLDHTLPRASQHPGNVWALHGYHECLVRLGKTDAAAIIAQQLKLASAVADVPIQASCFCRVAADQSDNHCCH
ncbi:tetratricopeptide repeat protein, partial [Nocardia sp. NPDC004722]